VPQFLVEHVRPVCVCVFSALSFCFVLMLCLSALSVCFVFLLVSMVMSEALILSA
jgi:hypothetical protein